MSMTVFTEKAKINFEPLGNHLYSEICSCNYNINEINAEKDEEQTIYIEKLQKESKKS